MYIFSIITREKGKLKTHSPIYCVMDNWENMLNLTHILDKMYLTGKLKRIRIFALIIPCTIIMETKSRYTQNVYAISDRTWCNKHLRHTTTENIIMGTVDTSDLMYYQYKKSHHKAKKVSRPFYLMKKIPIPRKTVFILRRGPKTSSEKGAFLFRCQLITCRRKLVVILQAKA